MVHIPKGICTISIKPYFNSIILRKATKTSGILRC